MIWLSKGESSLQDVCSACGHIRAAHPFDGPCVDCLRFGYGVVCALRTRVREDVRSPWRWYHYATIGVVMFAYAWIWWMRHAP
jgi:hypothetical protein